MDRHVPRLAEPDELMELETARFEAIVKGVA